MHDCECLGDCILYSEAMAMVPGITHMYRDTYCNGSHFTCARYKAYQALGEGNVPADLFPHQHDRLKSIVV